MQLKVIAKIHNGFIDKFGIPRQSGLTHEKSSIIFEPEYRNSDSLRGLEGFSHLWLIWHFSKLNRDINKWSPTVRPPRLGGNKRMGVFATRSPNRPNPIGLTVVKIEEIDLTSENAPKIIVSGADLLDGTPIFDIKPYIPYADSVPTALGGFAQEKQNENLSVYFPHNLRALVSENDIEILTELLSQDPRPGYQNDPSRNYNLDYKNYSVSFTVNGTKLFVESLIVNDN